jgi:LmbE family N-acetylglucosaminyl deacetylase
MAKTLLAIGAHYDDCVFGIPGILLQAARKHYRVVILSLIGDYSNWSPTKGREKEFLEGTIVICKEYGAEMRYLKYASHRFDVNLETKRAVAAVIAEVNPEVGFTMWPHDRHHDHEVAAVLGKVALQHGDRLLRKGRSGRAVPSTPTTTGRGTPSASSRTRSWTSPRNGRRPRSGWGGSWP